MFSGIVHHKGRITSRESTDSGVRLVIAPTGPGITAARGDSIAVNGCCLTAAQATAQDGTIPFDVIPQTLSLTTLGLLQLGSEVNLECAITAATLLSGHLVQGHIDGVGEIIETRSDSDGGVRLRIAVPTACRDHIVPQGSIAVDGVSLTVAHLEDDAFEVALIPVTLAITTLNDRRPGDKVNLETDMIVKTIVQTMQRLDWSRLTPGRDG